MGKDFQGSNKSADISKSQGARKTKTKLKQDIQNEENCSKNNDSDSKNLKTESNFEEVIVATSLDRNTILLEINERKTRALIDSGASISCIQKSVLEKLDQNKNIEIQPSKLSRIIGVGGEQHQVFGQVTLKLNISGLKIDQNFIVLEHLHHSVILGLDFMKDYHVKIDFHKRIMTVMDELVSVSLICDSKFGYVRCMKPVDIPAETEIDIPVRISREYKNDTVLLEPSENLHSVNLVGARCLVTTCKGKAIMRVLNPTKSTIKVLPNRILAHVNVIDCNEIYSFDKPCADSVSNVNLNAESTQEIPHKEDIHFNIQNDNLTKLEKQKLQNFLNKNRDVFSTSLADLGHTNLFSHKIETVPGAKAPRLPHYRQDPVKKAETERQTNELLKAGLIQNSTSYWNSPVVLVKKKDNSWRFAVDYRKLNQITEPISQPLPRLEDVFDALGNSKAKVFSTLDLNSAFYQIELDPETRHKSAFVTHEGVFEWLRLPFGLRNAPMTFQMLMNLVLKGLNWKHVLCYIDDIFVFSPDFDTHLKHLDEVFQRLRDANLTLKPSKCHFGVDKVMFLGHIITENGVSVDTEKTDKIKNFPVPTTQKELRGFLGLCNYYRRFVSNYAKICVPMNQLLKKEIRKKFAKGDWTDECQRAFETLKSALISPPILRFPDMNRDFILTTDASGHALGYILGQIDDDGREYVVCYGGRAIRPEEKNWTVTELECLAVKCGIETYKHYLTHRPFTVYTDHKALQWLRKQKDLTGRLGRWSSKLQTFDFEIKHRKGTKNQNADALSRINYDKLGANSVGDPDPVRSEHSHGAVILTSTVEAVRKPQPEISGTLQCDSETDSVVQMTNTAVEVSIASPTDTLKSDNIVKMTNVAVKGTIQGEHCTSHDANQFAKELQHKISPFNVQNSPVPNIGINISDVEQEKHSVKCGESLSGIIENNNQYVNMESNIISDFDSVRSRTVNSLQGSSVLIEITLEYQDSPVACVTDASDSEPLSKLQGECPDFKDILAYLVKGELPEDPKQKDIVTVVANNQYEVKDGVLYHIYTARTKAGKDKKVLDPDRLLLQLAVPRVKRKEILEGYHDCLAGGGHFGVNRTFGAIRQKYFWPKMYQEIENYVKTCETCQRTKIARNRHPPPLTPLPVEEPFSRIHIDILGPLPKSKEGYQYVLLIVDSFSKWTEAHPLRTQDAKDTANVLYNEIFTRYGAPRTIVSDRGKNFMSKLVGALCEMFEVKKHHTTSYHPQTNATVERANSTLAQTLRAYIEKDQMNWPSLLPSIMMAFRATPCTETTGFSPYELLFGKNMHLPVDTTLIPKPSLGKDAEQYFTDLVAKLKMCKDIAKKNMETKQIKAKNRFDLGAKAPTFKVGDTVVLKQEKVPQGLSPKLYVKWDGPYRIMELGPNYTYILKHMETNKTYKYANAARLKLYHERQNDKNNENPLNFIPENITQGNDTPQTVDNQVDEGNVQNQPEQYDAKSNDIRIIHASKKGKKQWFKVLWPDNTKKWIHEPYVNPNIIKEYLMKYNRNGKKRKNKYFHKSSN